MGPEQAAFYKSKRWKKLAREVRRRDGLRCKRCGKRACELHVHHIRPWSLAPAHRLRKHNLVTLCKGCHDWVHSPSNRRKKYLILG